MRHSTQIKIPPSILHAVTKVRYAKGILLTGSQAMGRTSKNSDWDFHIILPSGHKRWRKTWRVGKTWAEVFCNDKNEILKSFEEDYKSGRGVDIFMFSVGKIIKDDNRNTLLKLQRKALWLWQKGPKPLTRYDKQWIAYNIATYMQDIEDTLHDNYKATLLVHHAIEELIIYYYRLAHVWLPRPKDRLADFKKRQPDLARLTARALVSSNYIKKANLTIKFGGELARKFHLKLSGELYIPPVKAGRTAK